MHKVTGKSKHSCDLVMPVTAEELNQHFAAISTDQNYQAPQPKSTAAVPLRLFSEYEVFRMLDTIKSTAMGLDGLPDWFIRLAAPVFSSPLTYLYNLSLEQSVVPIQWKSSRITPVPKVTHPLTCQDYRPISITPILSRIMEKALVKSFLYPVLIHSDHSSHFADQFAFRPTGSTTSALVYLLHQITQLLQEHDYVHLIALDFSKAFDTVRHHTLLSKLSQVPLPDCFFNWLIDYFHLREHQTKLGLSESAFQAINASIIQGSGIGPACYIFSASDLHPVYPSNILFKYADDTYIIVPAANTTQIPSEIENVAKWATANNLKLNTAKTCEMIVRLPSRKQVKIPASHLDIVRVESITVLGVSFTCTLSFAPHVHNVIAKAARSLYAIKTLRAHGLQGQALFDVTTATLVAQLLYASSAWWGFLGMADKQALQAILSKASRYGFLPPCYTTLAQLIKEGDDTFFSAICSNENHVLHHLLPDIKETGYDLRPINHGYTLPRVQSNIQRKTFMYRMLYTDIY